MSEQYPIKPVVPPLRVIRLEAEGFKRLRAVDITPQGDLVVVGGRNAQGKSSVLDAIWSALGGAAASKGTPRPIRDGEDEAVVTVDLGEIVVTRRWKGERSTLTVTNADGAKHPSPQALLDALVGKLSFDPLAFAHASERDQRATLLSLVELPWDLATFDSERAEAFAERTDVGRRLKASKATLASMPKPAPDVPAEEVSLADLLAERRAANEAEQRAITARQWLRSAEVRRENAERALEQAQRELAAAVAQQDVLAQDVRDLPPVPDGDAIDDRLAGLEQTNRAIREAKTYATTAADVENLQQSWDTYTAHLDELDRERVAALASAAFPLEGLGFDDSGVTYQGVPLAQASGAEQLRVSVAAAMALNPRVRVIRITDGSLLDSDNMDLLADMAAAEGFQCWIERVGEDDRVGVLIEDGRVVGQDGEA